MTTGDILVGEPPPQPAAAKRVHISRRQILRSVLSNWSFLVVNALVAFLMTPFVVRHLGNSAYGVWALVLQLTGYMGVVDVGLRSALVRFVSSAHAVSDQNQLNRLLSGATLIYGAMAPLSLLGGASIAVFALPHLNISPDFLGTAQKTLLIAALIIACDFLFATYHATLAGLSRWDIVNGVGIATLLARTVVIVLLLERGYGLVTLALIQLAANLTTYSVETVLVRRLLPKLRLVWSFPDWAWLRPVLAHSWYSLLLSLANRVNYQIDTIVIAIFLPVSEVTYYVIGLRLVEYFRDVLNSTTMIISPLVSSLEAVGESDRIIAMLVRGTKYSLLIAFLGIAGFLSLGTDFIRLWMGSPFALVSGKVLIVLTLGLLASSSQFASSHVLFGVSKHRINVRWTTVESILNLAFSLLLVRNLGIVGVAAGTSIANLIVRGWFYPKAVLRGLSADWKRYVVHGILPAIPPAVSFCVAVLLYKHYVPIRNFAEFILAGLSGMLLFSLCLPFGLDREDRVRIGAKIKTFAHLA